MFGSHAFALRRLKLKLAASLLGGCAGPAGSRRSVSISAAHCAISVKNADIDHGYASELLVCLRRFSTQVSGGNGRKGGRPEIRHRGLREDRTSASVKAAAVEEEVASPLFRTTHSLCGVRDSRCLGCSQEKFEPWEGFQGDLAR